MSNINLPKDYLIKLSQDRGLSPDQEEVFLLRLFYKKQYKDIAAQLETSAQACQKRMGQVYRKFGIIKGARGKETRLRALLNNEFKADGGKVSKSELDTDPASAVSLEPVKAAPSPIRAKASKKIKLIQNLPSRSYRDFVGRESELQQLTTLLSPEDTAHLISITGIAGTGKTSLALELAYQCADAIGAPGSTPVFENIVFCSAQKRHLTPERILNRFKADQTLDHILATIQGTLTEKDTGTGSFEEVIDLVSKGSTLIVIDNWETIENQNEVLSFLYELPPNAKVIITSRELLLLDYSVRLGALTLIEGLQLIEDQAKEQNLQLSKAQAKELYQGTGGIPLSIIYCLGQMAIGYSVKNSLQKLIQEQSDFVEFSFQQIFDSIGGTAAEKLIMGLSLFTGSAEKEAMINVAQVDGESLDTADALVNLQRLCVFEQSNGRYTMPSLIRSYISPKIEQDTSFYKKASQQWLNWYKELGSDLESLEPMVLRQDWDNIHNVMTWCLDNKEMQVFKTLLKSLALVKAPSHNTNQILAWHEALVANKAKASEFTGLAQVMLEQSKVLIAKGGETNLSLAQELLVNGVKWQDKKDKLFSIDLILIEGILALRQGEIDQAKKLINQVKTELPQAKLDAEALEHFQLFVNYYQAEISYRYGDFNQANALYVEALEQAKQVEWPEAITAIKNWLADVALAQGKYNEADRLLASSLPEAEKNGDLVSVGFHQKSWSIYYLAKNNIEDAKKYIALAHKNLASQGIEAEAEEVQVFWNYLKKKRKKRRGKPPRNFVRKQPTYDPQIGNTYFLGY